MGVHKLDSKSLKYRQILISKNLDFSDDENDARKTFKFPLKDQKVLEEFETFAESPLGPKVESAKVSNSSNTF